MPIPAPTPTQPGPGPFPHSRRIRPPTRRPTIAIHFLLLFLLVSTACGLWWIASEYVPILDARLRAEGTPLPEITRRVLEMCQRLVHSPWPTWTTIGLLLVVEFSTFWSRAWERSNLLLLGLLATGLLALLLTTAALVTPLLNT